MSFAKKTITLTFTLQTGSFAGTSSNSLTVSGLRCMFQSSQTTLIRTQAQIRVYGLTGSQMNQLSTYGLPIAQQVNNTISVQAGDVGSVPSLLFSGNISQAVADYNQQPDSSITVDAYSAGYFAVAPAAALSYTGSTPVATIMGNIAGRMGLRLENSGVSVSLSNPVFPGSLVDQMRACARHANINAFIDDAKKVLAIWPKNGGRQGGQVVSISPQSGLVGYPTFGINQVLFVTEFNPSIQVGGQVHVQSSLQPATGQFYVQSFDTALATETPGGPWFQNVLGVKNAAST